ncbi:hypothetical protein OAS93_00735 [Gammaproteobacteria bacterium]|nr:hypothetical protein [Gammaproteobacteria bacterium]|tara:strand:+ start:56 stop:418 length:363 start_codon:yes stop_codon:yes gene_type:complete
MNNWFLISSAILSFLGMVFHGFIGGKMYKTNINKSNLEPLGKTLSLFSWQFHTIFLFVASCTLFYISSNPEFSIAAYPIIYMNILGAIYFFILGIGNREVLKMPGAILMGAIALLAWFGI